MIDGAFSSTQSFARSLPRPGFVRCVHTVDGKAFSFDQISVKLVSQHFEVSWFHVATVNRDDAELQQTVQMILLQTLRLGTIFFQGHIQIKIKVI